jgi:hypothetical protein
MPDFYNPVRLPVSWCSEMIQAWVPSGFTIMKLFGHKSLGTLAVASQIANGLEAKNGFDVFKYVDPLIGTSNGGEN